MLGRATWRWLRGALPLLAVAAVAAAALAAVALLPPFFTPDLEDPQAHFEVQDRARLTVAAIIGGLLVLAGAYINWRRVSALEKQVATAERGQITDRFTRAIDQLGAVRPDNTPASQIRAGGIRSLERIARESAEDFWPILDILTAYLRSESPIPGPDSPDDWWDRAYRTRDRMDVAFAIEAIQRLWPGEREPAHTPLNLAWTFAPRIAFRSKNLDGGSLISAYLRIADLQGAKLSGADLRSADLQYADLRKANLRGISDTPTSGSRSSTTSDIMRTRIGQRGLAHQQPRSSRGVRRGRGGVGRGLALPRQ